MMGVRGHRKKYEFNLYCLAVIKYYKAGHLTTTMMLLHRSQSNLVNICLYKKKKKKKSSKNTLRPKLKYHLKRLVYVQCSKYT